MGAIAILRSAWVRLSKREEILCLSARTAEIRSYMGYSQLSVVGC